MKGRFLPILAWTFGTLVIAGGIFGYVCSGSVMSLVAGLVLGTLMIVSGCGICCSKPYGRYLGIATSAILTVVFCIRFAKTMAWVPSGTLALIGALVLICLIAVKPDLKTRS